MANLAHRPDLIRDGIRREKSCSQGLACSATRIHTTYYMLRGRRLLSAQVKLLVLVPLGRAAVVPDGGDDAFEAEFFFFRRFNIFGRVDFAF